MWTVTSHGQVGQCVDAANAEAGPSSACGFRDRGLGLECLDTRAQTGPSGWKGSNCCYNLGLWTPGDPIRNRVLAASNASMMLNVPPA